MNILEGELVLILFEFVVYIDMVMVIRLEVKDLLGDDWV